MDGLEYIHENKYVHRDIKPHNLLLCKKETGERIVKISDFGLSKYYPTAGKSKVTKKEEKGLGTPFFVSLEQYIKPLYAKPIDDVYSVGISFYYLLTGRVPYSDPDQGTLWAWRLMGKDDFQILYEGRRIPVQHWDSSILYELAVVIDKAVEKDANKRFQSAREFKEAIQNAIKQK